MGARIATRVRHVVETAAPKWTSLRTMAIAFKRQHGILIAMAVIMMERLRQAVLMLVCILKRLGVQMAAN